MAYLTANVLDAESHKIRGAMAVLNKLGVVGFLAPSDMKAAMSYLRQRAVMGFRYNEAKGLIWMHNIGEVLDRRFSGLERDQKALPAPTKYPTWPGGSSDIKEL